MTLPYWSITQKSSENAIKRNIYVSIVDHLPINDYFIKKNLFSVPGKLINKIPASRLCIKNDSCLFNHCVVYMYVECRPQRTAQSRATIVYGAQD